MARVIKSLPMPARGFQHREHRPAKTRVPNLKRAKHGNLRKRFLAERTENRRQKVHKIRL